MESLSNELLFNILFYLPYEEILEKCRTSIQFNDICQDPYFWELKLKNDFPTIPRNPDLTAREQYEQLYHKNPCWIGNIIRRQYVQSDCIKETVQTGNLARLKEYFKYAADFNPINSALKPDYIYEILRLAIEYHQWNIVNYLLPKVPAKTIRTKDNLYDIGIELARENEYDLSKLAILRAIDEEVQLAYGENAILKVFAALAEMGNEYMLDWFLKEIRHNRKIKNRNFLLHCIFL